MNRAVKICEFCVHHFNPVFSFNHIFVPGTISLVYPLSKDIIFRTNCTFLWTATFFNIWFVPDVVKTLTFNDYFFFLGGGRSLRSTALHWHSIFPGHKCEVNRWTEYLQRLKSAKWTDKLNIFRDCTEQAVKYFLHTFPLLRIQTIILTALRVSLSQPSKTYSTNDWISC